MLLKSIQFDNVFDGIPHRFATSLMPGENEGDKMRPIWLFIGVQPDFTSDAPEPSQRCLDEFDVALRSCLNSGTLPSDPHHIQVMPEYVRMNVMSAMFKDEDKLVEAMTGPNMVEMQSTAAANSTAILRQFDLSAKVVVGFGKPKNHIIAWQCLQFLSMVSQAYDGVIWTAGVDEDNWPMPVRGPRDILQPYRGSPIFDGKTMEQVLSDNILRMSRMVRGAA